MVHEFASVLSSLRDAARVCRHVQRDIERVRSMTKDDRSPVTIADFASQAVVARALGGGESLVAEESADFLEQPGHAPHLEAVCVALRESGAWFDATREAVIETIRRGSGDPRGPDDPSAWWTLDPIDGTKGFIRGQQYAIALARIERGRVVLGAMACPNLSTDQDASLDAAHPAAAGSLYVAVAGRGVMEWSLSRPDGRRLEPRSTDLAGGTPAHASAGRVPVLAESVESGHSDHSTSSRIMSAALGEHRIVRLDSQAKYAVVARGQADVYLRLPTRPGYVERIWDHAAGALIAAEAGCVVTDLRGRELDFSCGRGLERNVGILVAPRGLHGRLLKAVAAYEPKA